MLCTGLRKGQERAILCDVSISAKKYRQAAHKGQFCKILSNKYENFLPSIGQSIHILTKEIYLSDLPNGTFLKSNKD